MAKSYRHKLILLTIKHYYKELIKQPQVHAFQYYNNKQKENLICMFPEKLFPRLTDPNLGRQACSYGTGTHTSSMSSLEEAVLFFQLHCMRFHAFIYRKPWSAETQLPWPAGI